MISYLWNVPNRRLTTGLKNKLKATFEIEQCWFFAVLWWPFWKWRPVEIFRCRESIQVVEIKQCWICAVLWWPFWKWWPVGIFQCRDIIIYQHIKFWWYRTMLNSWGIVVAILKMATTTNFSMSGISLSTHISNFDDIGQCWIFAVLWWPFWKWRPVEISQCQESIRDIIIYPHIQFWWYRTMLNFYRPFFMPYFGSHFENSRHLENFENAELLL
jgi:hypothetical protein